LTCVNFIGYFWRMTPAGSGRSRRTHHGDRMPSQFYRFPRVEDVEVIAALASRPGDLAQR